MNEASILSLAAMICSTIALIYSKYTHTKISGLCKECKYTFEPREKEAPIIGALK